jgi:hypothetical protein
LVNSVKNDEKDCLLPRAEFKEKSLQKGLGKFFKKRENSVEVEFPKIEKKEKKEK